ncbi:necrosis inducing protein-domain-containing protein [Xylariomycetidae sp. FL2044]|nr:necrosis inducing protein-domain-containing protein [Xylariomycetidae sp. FL2044]KAH9907629.1 necrosis inducing protein-domain-containing protein [Xylariomycetidae sp. FL2044]
MLPPSSWGTTISLLLLTASLADAAVMPPIGNSSQVAPLQPLPKKATQADLKWQPAMDFDADACYNVPAISPNGTISEGFSTDAASPETSCRDKQRLDNANVYSRARCNQGWCAYLYYYFFEKDQICGSGSCGIGGTGHRYDWENVVVWVRQDGGDSGGDKAAWVATSAHGKYDVKAGDEILWQDGTHPKIVYHKTAGTTHSMRDADGGDAVAENEDKAWKIDDLVSVELRDKMLSHDYGHGDISGYGSNFPQVLKDAMPGEGIDFDPTLDADGSPGTP